jgi:hypothetical protein
MVQSSCSARGHAGTNIGVCGSCPKSICEVSACSRKSKTSSNQVCIECLMAEMNAGSSGMGANNFSKQADIKKIGSLSINPNTG